MQRRFFVISLMGSFVAPWILKTILQPHVFPTARDRQRRELADKVTGLFHHREHAKAIGLCYLQQHPDKANIDLLIADAGIDGHPYRGDRSLSLLKTLVDASQSRDFIEGRTVMLNNWILSRTEVSLCALAALS
jgi:hypothetical protein